MAGWENGRFSLASTPQTIKRAKLRDVMRKGSLPGLSALPDRLTLALEWALLFLVLVGAIWAATLREDAPQLVLLSLLIIISLNFSLPPARGASGLTPVVAVSSLLILGLETAVLLLAVSIFLAELARPLWQPLWEHVDVPRPSWPQRLGVALVHLLSLVSAGWVFQQAGGLTPLNLLTVEMLDLNLLVLLMLAYGFTYTGLMLLLWPLWQRPLHRYLSDNLVPLITYGLLAQPFAWLGAITFIRDGLPTFVIFGLGVCVFSIVVWLSWQRHYIMEQRLAQFTALNQSGASLRETLDPPTVLARIHALVTELAPQDRLTLLLPDGAGGWQRANPDASLTPHQPDDFSRWVIEQGRVLDLEQRDLPFAAHHQLSLPDPPPVAWLGIPLTAVNRLIGLMVVQRLAPAPPFNRWRRELLLTIAGQASAALENARLYSETLRLYNLTDEALARRVKQLQALLDSMQEGVLLIDQTGRIVLLNTGAAALLGQSMESLWERPLPAPAAAASLGFTPAELNQLLEQLRAGTSLTTRQNTFNAGNRFFNRLEAPVQSGEGQLLGWLMLFRDVTEERQLAERRADLSRMIVHDLRNPLTTLISTINLLESQWDSPGQVEIGDLFETARHGCLDMLDMVDSLMDINRLEAGLPVAEVEAMRLPPLVERVVKRLGPLAQQRGIRLSFAPPPPDLPAVWADEEMVRRVLLNLLDNALKFTPTGGVVNGRLLPEPVPGSDAEPGARCIIHDSGPGIPANLRERVFDRFSRTDQVGAPVRGTGLGLTFCKLAIEAQNGRIWVEDAPEGGSQFVFTLPGIPQFAEIEADGQ
jgi:PAS domain S-box-containing protein